MPYLALIRPLLPYLAIVAVASLIGWKIYQFGYSRGEVAGAKPYQEAVAEAATRYAQAVAEQQVTIDDLQDALRRSRTATTATTSRLEATLTHEPESRDWGAVRLPDAVRLLVSEAGDTPVPTDPERPH
jgi:hypothetical protein